MNEFDVLNAFPQRCMDEFDVLNAFPQRCMNEFDMLNAFPQRCMDEFDMLDGFPQRCKTKNEELGMLSGRDYGAPALSGQTVHLCPASKKSSIRKPFQNCFSAA